MYFCNAYDFFTKREIWRDIYRPASSFLCVFMDQVQSKSMCYGQSRESQGSLGPGPLIVRNRAKNSASEASPAGTAKVKVD